MPGGRPRRNQNFNFQNRRSASELIRTDTVSQDQSTSSTRPTRAAKERCLQIISEVNEHMVSLEDLSDRASQVRFSEYYAFEILAHKINFSTLLL